MNRRRRARHRGLCLAAALALCLPICAQRAAGGGSPARSRDRALTRQLDRLLADPNFTQGFFGVYVFSLDRQRVVFDHNGDHLFTPASNAKLTTLAAALALLGPDFRFHTTVETAAAPLQGVIAGDVALVGVGDPSLSGRRYPYRLDPSEPALPFDPLVVPRALAAQMKARGVRRITGDIVGDDSYFAPDPYPDGWDIGDELWDYGAPVSALTLNDSTRWLQVFPAAMPGAPPRLAWSPGADAPTLRNLATTVAATGAPTGLELHQDPYDGTLTLSGAIAATSPGELFSLAVPAPARFAAQLLRQALLEDGITVEGGARARHRAAAAAAPAFVLAHWDSPPLEQILQATAKVSQNLEAELLLRDLGKLRGAPPAAPAGAQATILSAAFAATEAARGGAVVAAFLHSAGLSPRDTVLYDGSGLSRQDLVTPAGLVRLLRYMDRQPTSAQAATWRGLLPLAGRDGTLAHRFLKSPAAGRIEAKTGSLNHVNSLSGYLTSRHGERFAFALLSNNVERPAAQVRAQLDRLAGAIASW